MNKSANLIKIHKKNTIFIYF